jgi:hypothetical protein
MTPVANTVRRLGLNLSTGNFLPNVLLFQEAVDPQRRASGAFSGWGQVCLSLPKKCHQKT